LNEFALEFTTVTHGGHGTSRHEKALYALAADYHTVSRELAAILQRPRLASGKNSRWKSLKKVWESMRWSD